MRTPFAIPLSQNNRAYYQKARWFMYGLVLLAVGNFLSGVLFPTFTFPFDFRTPGSLKNTLIDPRAENGSSLASGRVKPGDILVANASVFGRFSRAQIKATVRKDSALPETLTVELRRSYRSFLYPTGEAITGFPAGSRYRVADTYYELRDNILYPFVSEGAFLSRYPLAFGQPAGRDLLERFPVSEQWIGYRPGSLLAFADGVFVVTSEEEVRPIGSAEIFLRLGYQFENVGPASAEEVGIYRRGRIILLGAPHPDGTIFQDNDSGTYYLIEKREKRPFLPSAYRDFLLSKNGVILASGADTQKMTTCQASPAFSGRSLGCTAPLASLAGNLGYDYEVRLGEVGQPMELERLVVSLKSEKSLASARRLLTQVKVRFLIRFGYTQE